MPWRSPFIERLDERNLPTATPLGSFFLIHGAANLGGTDTKMAADGSFILVWADTTPANPRIVAQRFDRAGAPVGGEITVSSYALDVVDPVQPKVGIDDAGDFVVAWHTVGPTDRDAYYRRFDAAGNPLNPATLLSTAAGDQFLPNVDMNASGQFVCAWVSTADNANRFANFSAAGSVVGSGAYGSASSPLPICISGTGTLAVAYSIHRQGGGNDLDVRWFASNGNVTSTRTVFQITSILDFRYPLDPAIDMDAAGNVVVGWMISNFISDPVAFGYATRNPSSGGGAAPVVNTGTIHNHNGVKVASSASGGYCVVNENYSDGSIHLSQVSSSTSVTPDSSMALAPQQDNMPISIARNASGRFLVTLLNTGTAAPGLYARIYEPISLSAGGPYQITEGQSLTLNAAGTNPGGYPLTYSWDLNGDNNFNDAAGPDPTLTWNQLAALGITSGPSTWTMRAKIVDSEQATTTANATLSVANAPPSLAVSANGAPGQPGSVRLTLAASDPSAADAAANFVFEFDWDNDGVFEETVTSVKNLTKDRFYGAFGPRTARLRVKDRDGAYSPTISTTFEVGPVNPPAPGSLISDYPVLTSVTSNDSLSAVPYQGRLLVARKFYWAGTGDIIEIDRIDHANVERTNYVPLAPSPNSGAILAVQSDNRVLVAGQYLAGSVANLAVARIGIDGLLDVSFDGDGIATLSLPEGSTASAVAVQFDGKILVCGTAASAGDSDFILVRFNADGSLDSSFGAGGIARVGFAQSEDVARAMALGLDGKIFLAGTSSLGGDQNFAVARLNPDGSLDSTFDSDGKNATDLGSNTDAVSFCLLRSDGRLVVGGTTTTGTHDSVALVRYSLDGTLDQTFGIAGRQIDDLGEASVGRDGALQADGKIVVVGAIGSAGNTNILVLRYGVDGHLDQNFDLDGQVVTTIPQMESAARAVVLDQDGTIIVVANGAFPGGHAIYVNSYYTEPRAFLAGFAVPTSYAGQFLFSLYAYGTIDQLTDQFMYLVDWDGDGTIEEATQSTSMNHTFASSANVHIVAVDRYGARSAPLIFPVDLAARSLAMAGSDRVERISFSQVDTTTIGGIVYTLAGVAMNGGSGLPFYFANITGRVLVTGGGGDDSIVMSSSVTISAEFHGGAGSDTLTGGAGADLLIGDDGGLSRSQLGRDEIRGGAGDDLIYGDADGGEGASDALYGEDGNDSIVADGAEGSIDGSDFIQGGTGNDTIRADGGEGGPDRIDSGAGDDFIDTGKGNDVATAGDGNDILLSSDGGEGGDDILSGDAGRDLLVGGAGHDVLRGGADDDILLAGQLSLATAAAVQPALTAIESEWTSNRAYADRVANIAGTGTGPRNNGNNFLIATGPDRNVLDDGAIDDVFGEADTDWFLVRLDEDLASDLGGGETTTPIGP